jgi:hypothetical protein
VRVYRIGVRGLAADLDTDTEGRFQASGLPSGEIRVEISKPNYVPVTLNSRIDEKSGPTHLTVRLVRCGAISGRVTTQQGQPMRGAHAIAMLKPADGGPLRPASTRTVSNFVQTDERGQYRLYNLPPGQYVVAISYGASTTAMGMTGSAPSTVGVGSGVAYYPNNRQPQSFQIAGGEDYRGVDFSISPLALYSVNGKVELPAPKTRYWLALTPIDQPAIAFAVTQTEEDGSYRFAGVPPGSYHLFVPGPTRARGFMGAVLEGDPRYARTQVEISSQNLEGISLTPEKGRTASFIVRPTGAGCPQSVQLTLFGLEDWSSVLDRTIDVTLDKEAIVENLAPGRYRAAAAKLGGACFLSAGATVDFRSKDDSNPVAVQIAPAGSIRGRLAGLETASDFTVVLLDSNGTVRVAKPDGEARFAFDGLPPGPYRIAASKARWIHDMAAMVELNVRGGGSIDVELSVPKESRQ